MIAIDSSVLIDLLGGDANADAAEASLRQALTHGPVVACDIVVSEIVAGLGRGSEVVEAIEEIGIHFAPIELAAAVRAGEMQRRYKERLKSQGLNPRTARAIPDFIVGAHALLQCKGLITRDVGFFRDYFKGLKVIVPKSA
jgi:hypothetical protein